MSNVPSGPGQTDKDHSLSVVFATDADASTPTKFAAVTKSDSTDLTNIATKGLYVGGAGDVAVKGVDDSSATTLVGVLAGTFIPGHFSRVMSTNTTATNIVAIG